MIEISHSTKAPSEDLLKRAKAAVAKLPAITESGFIEILSNLSLWTESQTRGEWIHQNFKTLGILGIGGSSLGPKVIDQCLEGSRQLLICENVDPLSLERKWRNLDWESTHWLVISKSGKTLETLSQLTLLFNHFNRLGMKASHHFTVISDPVSNPLTQWAADNGVVQMAIPSNVGGRFSVLTPVGLVPSAFMGHSVALFREGAEWASLQQDLVAEIVAQTLASFQREEWISVFWFYSDLMAPLGGWIQQLWAESLGKKFDRAGQKAQRSSTPLSLIGANDQHSILQQVMEGPRDKFIWFFSHAASEKSGESLHNVIGLPQYLEGQSLGKILSAERRATQKALEAEGIQSMTITVQDLSPRTLGALFMIFEMTVAAIAESLNINAFDQPGVELGKRLAYEILQRER